MEDRLHRRTVKIRNNKDMNEKDPLRPSNAILPPDLFNDVYDDIKFNGGSGRNLFRDPFGTAND